MVFDWNKNNIKKIAEKLVSGGIAVIPTDTLYGIVASATNQEAVEKVYLAKGRRPNKPAIILISSIEDLNKFAIHFSEFQRQILLKYWPGKISIVLPCENERYKYLHRETKTLAFRLPNEPLLLELLKISGPLIAPSANPEGKEPALTIDEAKIYFNGSVDVYVNAGTKNSPPSTLISVLSEKIEVLRGKLE